MDPQPEPIKVEMKVSGVVMKDILPNLLGRAKQFCEAVGLHESLITQIIDTDDDWSLILKVDTLLETAAKEILRKHLHSTLDNKIANKKAMEEFIDGLRLQGRTSVIKLINAFGFTEPDLCFVRAVETVRNAYAHDIRNLNVSLFELIDELGKKNNKDKNLLEHLCLKDHYEATLKEKNAKFLRAHIIFLTLIFLYRAYDVAVKPTE